MAVQLCVKREVIYSGIGPLIISLEVVVGEVIHFKLEKTRSV